MSAHTAGMAGNDLSLAAWKRVALLIPHDLQGYAREWGMAVEAMHKGTTSAETEWMLWRSLCEALQESGAVTTEDLKAPVSKSGTPGLRLLRALRAWGEARAAIAKAEVKS